MDRLGKREEWIWERRAGSDILNGKLYILIKKPQESGDQ